MSRLEVWHSRLRVWVPPLVFLVLNLVFLSAYRMVYQGRQILLENRIEQAESGLGTLDRRAAGLREQLERAVRTHDRIDQLNSEILGLESERLTRVISEVQGLEADVGLEPRATSYPEDRLEDFGLVRKAVVFGVEGSYVQLRKFIHRLELSDSFLILEEVGLSNTGGSDKRLRINLRLATYFVDPRALEEAKKGGRTTGRRRRRDG